MARNLFLFKGDFSFGKSQSHGAANLGWRWADLPGRFDVRQKTAWDVIHEQVCCDEAANHQLLIAVAFWIIQIVSMEECSSLMQNLMQTYSTVLSHFECDSYTGRMLTQQCLSPPLTISTVKSSLFTHVHSSPLSLAARLHQCCAHCFCYINNGWTFSGQTFYFRAATINLMLNAVSWGSSNSHFCIPQGCYEHAVISTDLA